MNRLLGLIFLYMSALQGIGVAAPNPKATVRWEKKVHGSSSQRSVFPRKLGANRIAVHHQNADGTYTCRVLDALGQEKASLPGLAEGITEDGRYLIGQSGVVEIETGKVLWNRPLISQGVEQIVLSASGQRIALVPGYESGETPSSPFLKVYSLDGKLLADYTEKVGALAGERPFEFRFYAKFISDDGLVVFYRKPTTSGLVLFSLGEGGEKWSSETPHLTGNTPEMMATQDGVVVLIERRKFVEGKWSFDKAVCSYRLEDGAQQWCQHGNFLHEIVSSSSGDYIGLVEASGKHEKEGLPSYATWKTKIFNSRSGEKKEEFDYLGRLLSVGNSGERAVAITGDGFRIFRKGKKPRELDFPEKIRGKESFEWGNRVRVTPGEDGAYVVSGDEIYSFEFGPD